MKSMSSLRMLALLLAASVMLVELQVALADESASAKKATSKSATRKAKVPKIRRTIRMIEEPEAAEAAKEEAPKGQIVEMKNVGPTNQVDVKPNISIAAPGAPAPVEREHDDRDEEPQEAERESNMQIVPYEEQLQQQQQGNQMAVVNEGNNNDIAELNSNSGNQMLSLGQNNGNVLKKVLSNSGNTETVHIDGVGNNKVTRISNAGNTEHQLVENSGSKQASAQLVSQQAAPLAGLGLPMGPLVQISMNNEGQMAQTRPPANYLVAPSMVYPQMTPFDASNLLMAHENLSHVAGEMAPLAPYFQQAYQPMPASQMMSPLAFPQMALQSAAPMMMMPQAPMMMPQAPMMMLSTLVTPREWRRLMRDGRKHRHCNHPDHEHEHKPKKGNKEKKQKKEKKEKKKKEKVIEIHEEPKEEVVVVPAKPEEPSKVVQLIKPLEKKLFEAVTPKPKEPAKEKEEDEEEEVIEWETVRVPKKRKVLKQKKNQAN